MWVELPGGLWTDGARLRGFAFVPVTGRLELALSDITAEITARPVAVTEALCAALAVLGGEPPTRERVAGLCVGDRDFLLRRLQIHLGHGQGWRHTRCRSCGEVFDFHLDLAELPVSAAGPGYPFATVEGPAGEERFRLPTGQDQEAIGMLPDLDAEWALAERCWIPGRTRGLARRWRALQAGGDEMLGRIEAALDAVAPAVVRTVGAACPQCGAANDVGVDPHEILERRPDDLLGEVHQLAIHYHWSEREILELRRPRRQRYLQMIDAARGLSH